METFHGGEGGEQSGGSNLETNTLCLRLFFLLLSIALLLQLVILLLFLMIYLVCTSSLHSFHFLLYCRSILIQEDCNTHLKLLSRGITRKEFRALHRVSGFQSCFGRSLHHIFITCLKSFQISINTYSPPSRCFTKPLLAIFSIT